MKYIRTKDGKIIELPKEPTLMMYDNVVIDLNAVRKGKVGYEIINALIDKQADTIEELCDELVVHNPNNDNEFHPQWFIYLNSWKNMLNEKHAKHCVEFYDKPVEIYGAIWTDKGLIFVAKMNDKGELELV